MGERWAGGGAWGVCHLCLASCDCSNLEMGNTHVGTLLVPSCLNSQGVTSGVAFDLLHGSTQDLVQPNFLFSIDSEMFRALQGKFRHHIKDAV